MHFPDDVHEEGGKYPGSIEEQWDSIWWGEREGKRGRERERKRKRRSGGDDGRRVGDVRRLPISELGPFSSALSDSQL